MTPHNHPRHPNQLNQLINPINEFPATRSRSALGALRFTPATRKGFVLVLDTPSHDASHIQLFRLRERERRRGRLEQPRTPNSVHRVISIRNPKFKIPNRRTRNS